MFDSVVGGKGDSRGDGTLDEVHGKPLVNAAPTFRRDDEAESGPDGAIFERPVLERGRLHPAPNDVQRIGDRLTRQTRAGAVENALDGGGVARSIWVLVVILLQSFVDEEAGARVGDDADDGGRESAIERPAALLRQHLAKDGSDRSVLALVGDGHSGPSQVQRVRQRGRRGAGQAAGRVPLSRRRSLSLGTDDLLPFFMRCKLNACVGDDSDDGGRVAAPQGEKPVLASGLEKEANGAFDRIRTRRDLKVNFRPV